MSSSSNNFPTGVSYLDNIQNIKNAAWAYPGGSAQGNANADGIDAFWEALVGTVDGFNLGPHAVQFFATFNSQTNPVPSSFNDFISQYSTFILAALGGSNLVGGPVSISNLAHINQSISDGYQKTYAYSVLQRQGNSSDWAGLISANTATVNQQALNAWPEIVKTLQYDPVTGKLSSTVENPNGTPVGPNAELTSFGVQVTKFLTIEAKLQPSTTVTIQTSDSTTATFPVPSYQDVYEAFFGTTTGFPAFVQQFYNDTLTKTGNGNPLNGYFIPSQQFGSFIDAVAKEFNSPSILTATSVTTDQSGRPAVINRIFRLLVLLITTLQGVAAAQANRLNVYTQWTKAYTDLMNQIPKFSGSDPNNILRDDGINVPNPISNNIHWNNDPTGTQPTLTTVPMGHGNDSRTVSNNPADLGDKAARASLRQELNDGVVAQVTERIRGYRDSVTNDSKAMQSVVNQSNDAVSQQTNMATALLQELSTLLGAIFR